MRHETEILIIGGGAIGICSAYYLSEQGRNVTVVEQGEICSGSSYGNAGIVAPSHSIPLAAPGMISKGIKWMFNPESPFYIKLRFNLELFSWLWKFRKACSEGQLYRAIPVIRDLNLASLQLFEELAAIEELDFGFEKRGLVVAFKTEKGFRDGLEEARVMREYGIETRPLEADEIQKLEKGIRTSAIGGVYYPNDAHIIPQLFVRELARYIEKRGVNIKRLTEVLGIGTSGRKVETVRTTRGDISANEVVLAGGAWSPGITRELDIKLPIQPAKGYSITFKRPPSCPPIPFAMAENKVILTPMRDTMRLAGTLELAGQDLSINRRRVQAILNSVSDYLPDIHTNTLDLIEIWRGLRPCTPDGLPFIGRSSIYSNLIVATGHAMLGITMSPITGKLISQLAATEEPLIDLTSLSVNRFH